MNRLSVRLKITLAFTAAMALVLSVFGVFLFAQTRAQLDESVDNNLEVRVADLAARPPDGTIIDQAVDPEDSFTQVVDADGVVEATSDQLTDEPVVSGTGSFDLESVNGLDGRVRVLGVALDDGRIAVAGASLEDRDESVRNLALLLTIGGPASLLLAAFGGWWVAGRALDPLEKGYERERRFVDDASHELRTPLALHKAELELALRYADDEAALRSAIESGVEEVDRLAQLADDLLVVARSGEEGLALRTEDVDVADLFETVATRFAGRVRASNRSLQVEAEQGLIVRADRLRIEQALTNLVENAIRHGAGRIELSGESLSNEVRLHVRDEGVGFGEEFREHAFERFTRGDAARGRGGAGLGLAIVDTIASAHGGKVEIASDSEVGADVWIELPRGV